jgi:hypothetical protein
MTPVKKPDLNAPRFRNSCIDVVNNELLKKIRTKNSKTSKVKLTDIRKVVKAFNEKLWNHVIDSRDGIELPEMLGLVYIGTCPPPKRKNIDMKKSIELGVAVEHKNWDTDGNLGKVIYTTFGNKYRFKNNELWAFKAGRTFKRSVSASYSEKWMIYKKIEKNKLISAQVRQYMKKDYVLKKSEFVLEDYNEFELD